MIRPRHRFPLRPLLLLTAAVAIATLPASALPPSARLQNRINDLLKRRLTPELLPLDPPNPFQVITGIGGSVRTVASEGLTPRRPGPVVNATAADAADGDAATAAPTNIDILSTVVSRLKFGGMIVLKDQPKIVINGVPRSEADMIPADWNNAVVYLKIVRLSRTEVVIRYGDAEATLKF